MVNNGIYKYEPLWGEWRIDGLIGKGSYGEVYRIYKMENGRRIEAAAKYISVPKNNDEIDVAVSTGKTDGDEQSLRRFFSERADIQSKEIGLLMKLRNDKNIVHYEAHIKEEKKDEIGWDIIIRMELLTSLNNYLKENRLKRKDVIRLGIDICGAIESCQREKIIHRDVKQENIFLDAYGNFKLGDFGVSREANGTTQGSVAGTRDYMAPEVIKNEKYNNTVDIYSLGIVLYRLLNKRRIPFLNPDDLLAPSDYERADEKRINGTEEMPYPKYADGKLAEIILKACNFDRSKRYATPQEMANDLKDVLDENDETVVLLPSRHHTPGGNSDGTMLDKPPGPTPEPQKKNRLKWLAIPLAVFVLCLAGIGIYSVKPKTIPISDITMQSDSVQAVVGETLQLTYTISPSDATETPTFASTDESIVEVSEEGELTFIAEGEAYILISSKAVNKDLKVSVLPEKIPVTNIRNVSSYETFTVGQSLTIKPQVVPENATEQTPIYASDNSRVATVGSDGVVTAKSAGRATISVTVDGVTEYMIVDVKAKSGGGNGGGSVGGGGGSTGGSAVIGNGNTGAGVNGGTSGEQAEGGGKDRYIVDGIGDDGMLN